MARCNPARGRPGVRGPRLLLRPRGPPPQARGDRPSRRDPGARAGCVRPGVRQRRARCLQSPHRCGWVPRGAPHPAGSMAFHRASVRRLAQPAHTGRRASRSAFRLRQRGCCLSSRLRAAYAACRRAWWASGREPPVVSRSVRAWERPKRRKIAPAGLRSLSCCFMPVTTTRSVSSYMWKPSS